MVPKRALLPPREELERRAKLVAALDSALEPDFALRYFDYDGAWARGQRLFTVRSGEGDHAFVWFGAAGAFVRGKANGKPVVAEEQLFAGLPSSLAAAKSDVAYDLGGDSFAAWSTKGSTTWSSAIDPRKGGMAALLGVLDGDPKTFAKYAREHHDAVLPMGVLRSLYDGAALTKARLAALGAPASRDPPAEPLGDGEFKVVRRGDETLLVVGGKVQWRAARAGLYYEIIEQVRAALRAAGGSHER